MMNDDDLRQAMPAFRPPRGARDRGRERRGRRARSAMVGGAPACRRRRRPFRRHDPRFLRHRLHRDRDRARPFAHRGALRAAGGRLQAGRQRAGQVPALKDIARIERDPQFDIKRLFAHLATADVALLKLAEPLPARITPVPIAGDNEHGRRRRYVRESPAIGVTVRGDDRSDGTVRAATLAVTGQPGSLANPPVRSGDQRHERRARRLRRRFRCAGVSRRERQPRDHRRRELVDRPELDAEAAAASPASRRWYAIAPGSSTRRSRSARRWRRDYSTPASLNRTGPCIGLSSTANRQHKEIAVKMMAAMKT